MLAHIAKSVSQGHVVTTSLYNSRFSIVSVRNRRPSIATIPFSPVDFNFFSRKENESAAGKISVAQCVARCRGKRRTVPLKMQNRNTTRRPCIYRFDSFVDSGANSISVANERNENVIVRYIYSTLCDTDTREFEKKFDPFFILSIKFT